MRNTREFHFYDHRGIRFVTEVVVPNKKEPKDRFMDVLLTVPIDYTLPPSKLYFPLQ